MVQSRVGKLAMGLVPLVALLLGCGTPSGPEIAVEDPWARPAFTLGEMNSGESTEGGMGHAKAGTGAVYMLLANEGSEVDRLTGAATDVANAVEIHETVMQGEVMKMRMLPDGILLPARSEVELKPGGYHIMLIGVKRDLRPADIFALELEFEKSAVLTIEVQVREP